MSAHRRTKKAAERFRYPFYWPGIKKDVTEYCSTCIPCQLQEVLLQLGLIVKSERGYTYLVVRMSQKDGIFFSRYLKSSPARVSSRSYLISGATGALLRDCIDIANGYFADLLEEYFDATQIVE
ncbi:hypothetical protein CEXT_488201 [Caerostris extrusa]|uniref:Integrase zinc-binding domain-containing protein n=1 Tax=Caerostris extrusa TaxID=172846 RepID=A0AAV4XKX6_CAEEX|nr:hypothetical protein CEXT_488201 [Caerostris extrusa]